MQWLILLSLCFATFNANSKAQENPTEQLLELEVAAYQLSSAFSAYVLFTGLAKYSQKLENIIETTNPLLASAKSTYPNIVEKWQDSLSFIENNKALVFSSDDHRLIIGFSTFQNPLYQLIDDKKQSTSPNTLTPALNEYLNTRVSFERVIAQYTAFSASSAGFVHSDTSIEENISDFSAHIKNITNIDADFQRLNLKWNFIKKNMLKSPGQTSPFVTLHTAIDIRETLQRIYSDELDFNLDLN